jgi:hypothetical protein
MLFIEIDHDRELVYWGITEYVEGKRHVIEDGSDYCIADAMYHATKELEKFFPEELV